jgi:hypothetical protein
MMDFLFFVKTFVLCLVITIVMQIRVGSKTIETHTHGFLETSAAMLPIQGAAHGGAQLIRDVSHRVTDMIKRNVKGSKNKEAAQKANSSFLWQGSRKPSQNETESGED